MNDFLNVPSLSFREGAGVMNPDVWQEIFGDAAIAQIDRSRRAGLRLPECKTQFMLDFESLGTDPDCAVVSVGVFAFDLNEPFQLMADRLLAANGLSKQVERLRDCPGGFTLGDGSGIEILLNLSTQPGRVQSPETCAWWLSKVDPESAMAQLFGQPRHSITAAMDEVCRFLRRLWVDDCSAIWCRGQDFDVPILDSLLASVDPELGIKLPGHYADRRDSRTWQAALHLGEAEAEHIEHMKLMREKFGIHGALSDAAVDAYECVSRYQLHGKK